ncbi:hypothetical protein JG688_00011940, partial [Phytophthora aleatoria]
NDASFRCKAAVHVHIGDRSPLCPHDRTADRVDRMGDAFTATCTCIVVNNDGFVIRSPCSPRRPERNSANRRRKAGRLGIVSTPAAGPARDATEFPPGRMQATRSRPTRVSCSPSTGQMQDHY